MSSRQNLSQVQVQTQKLTPQQLQLIQMLELPLPYLEEKVNMELQDNPALEADTDAPAEGSDAPAQEDGAADEGDIDPAAELAIAEELEKMLGDEDDYRAYSPPARSRDDDDRPFAATIRYQPSVYEDLQSQVALLPLTDEERQAAMHILGMLDDYGFLRKDTDTIRRELNFLYGIQLPAERVERIIKMLQELEPVGIAARSVQEALLAQLRAHDDWKGPVRDLAMRILEKYFRALSRRDYDYLMQALGVSAEQLQEALDMIRHLRPTPLTPEGRQVQTLVPDFIVRYRNGRFQVDLNNGGLPPLRVSPAYLEAYKREVKKPAEQRSKNFELYKSKIDRARHFIDSVRQRQNTMLRIMNAIVRRQADFFRTGDWKTVKPMVLRDIAEEIGMDISTVSRVTSNKVVDMDYGVIPLKKLFSEGVSSEDGMASSVKLKEIIKEMIAAEDRTRPLTDEEIAERLQKMGYNIARRTVAKYRSQLRIPSSSARRERPLNVGG